MYGKALRNLNRRMAAPRWLLLTLLSLGLSGHAAIATATETLGLAFDSYAPGAITSGGSSAYRLVPSLTVFVPPEGRTASPPNAARNGLDCNDATCSNGAYRIELDFNRLAKRVELSAGDVLVGCFEFDCPSARLVGYNAAGDIVAASAAKALPTGSTEQPAGFDSGITERFIIDAGAYTISRAVFYVGKDDVFGQNFGTPRPAQIDSLVVNVLQFGEPPPPPGEEPDAPTVEILDPLDNDIFLNPGVFVSGSLSADVGVAAFCVVANQPTFPASCDGAGAVHTNDDGSLGFGPMRVQGVLNPNATNVLTAWLRDGRGRTASDSVTISLSPDNLDLSVEAVEVTQVVQIEDIHTAADATRIPRASTSIPGFAAPYEGVPLAQRKKTLVRVFLDGALLPAGDLGGARVRDVPLSLYGFTDGTDDLPATPVTLPFSPLRPGGSLPMVAGLDLAVARADAAAAATFVLPVSWTQEDEIILAVEVASAASTTAFVDANPGDNGLFVEDIPFTPQRNLLVLPVPLSSTEGGTTSTPTLPLAQYFDGAITVTPAPVRLAAETAVLDISRPVMRARLPDGTFDKPGDSLDGIIDVMAEAFEDRAFPGKIVGLLTTPGVTAGKGPGPLAATGLINARLDFVAHELYHTYGYKHASSACNAGGAASWPPDNRGHLHGIGLDPRLGSGGPGLYKPIGQEDSLVFDATPDAPAEVHDLMSYCSNEGAGMTWLSTDYWTVGVRGFAPGGDIMIGREAGCCRLSPPDDVTARTDSLRVASVIKPDGSAEILRVSAVEAPADDATLGTGVELQLRNSAGDIISRTDVEPYEFVGRTEPPEEDAEPSFYVAATLNGDDAQMAELLVNGGVVASRSRSPNAPTVIIQRTPTGHCVAFGIDSAGPVPADEDFELAYLASDLDGDELTAKVQFSADGESWRTISAGIPGSPVSLPGRLLSPAAAASLRVVVNDGFNSASDTCGPFETEGRDTAVTIVSPAPGSEFNADSFIYLDGYAFDAEGMPVPGDRLEWTSGATVLGSGEILSTPAYKVNDDEGIMLTAMPEGGGESSATVEVTIHEVDTVFTVLEPKPLRGNARVIVLQVSSNTPEYIHVSGTGIESATYLVDPETDGVKTIHLTQRLPVHELTVRLGSGEGEVVKTFTIERLKK